MNTLSLILKYMCTLLISFFPVADDARLDKLSHLVLVLSELRLIGSLGCYTVHVCLVVLLHPNHCLVCEEHSIDIP